MQLNDYILRKNLLSFVIPCYRSEYTFEKVYNEIVSVVAERTEFDYEIVAVNDCSPDGVLTVLKQIAAQDKKLKIIDLSKNFGKHSAVMAGLSFVEGEFIVCLDDDWQCPVDRLWELVDAIVEDGYDCATASYTKKKESAWKLLGSRVNAYMVDWLIEPPSGIAIENFFVMKRYVSDEILNYSNPFPYISGLLFRSTNRVKMIQMDERERADEKSTGFTFKKSLALFFDGLTAFSVKPLRIASFIGFLFAFVGFLYGIVIVIQKLINPLVPMGYSSIMAVLLFSMGLIMILLGVIGEYLGRIYICINNSPQYVVRDTINIDDV